MEDDIIIEKVLRGDTEHFSILVEKYERFAYKFAYSLLSNHHLAQDSVCEAFLNAYKHLDKYKSGTSFKNWFLRIVHNISIDTIRKNKNVIYINDMNCSQATSDEQRIEERIIEKNDIENALKKLTPEMRAVVILRFYHDLDYKSISDILDIPIGTLSSRLNRASAILKTILREAR